MFHRHHSFERGIHSVLHSLAPLFERVTHPASEMPCVRCRVCPAPFYASWRLSCATVLCLLHNILSCTIVCLDGRLSEKERIYALHNLCPCSHVTCYKWAVRHVAMVFGSNLVNRSWFVSLRFCFEKVADALRRWRFGSLVLWVADAVLLAGPPQRITHPTPLLFGRRWQPLFLSDIKTIPRCKVSVRATVTWLNHMCHRTHSHMRHATYFRGVSHVSGSTRMYHMHVYGATRWSGWWIMSHNADRYVNESCHTCEFVVQHKADAFVCSYLAGTWLGHVTHVKSVMSPKSRWLFVQPSRSHVNESCHPIRLRHATQSECMQPSRSTVNERCHTISIRHATQSSCVCILWSSSHMNASWHPCEYAMPHKADAYVCSHPAAMCELFEGFNKTLIVYATTRYEMARCFSDSLRQGCSSDPSRWLAW